MQDMFKCSLRWNQLQTGASFPILSLGHQCMYGSERDVISRCKWGPMMAGEAVEQDLSTD
jgi:hypothetical protein